LIVCTILRLVCEDFMSNLDYVLRFYANRLETFMGPDS
jgi:hypothetical protein